jgi:isopentenyl diphosphate isomerase/L-lactate dehydrogenase-like FMN-dependent dehydrogenase
MVGRPQAWALAVGGAEAVERMLFVLQDELRTAMGLCGVTDVRDVPPALVFDRRTLRAVQ